VPIIQAGEEPLPMMIDLQEKYNWVLDTVAYDSIETLLLALKPTIIDPALEKHKQLRLFEAMQPKLKSMKDLLGE
jgi:hypothetical protein